MNVPPRSYHGMSVPGDLPGDHRLDAGHLLGLAGVDGEDPGVGVRAPEDGAVQHVRAA